MGVLASPAEELHTGGVLAHGGYAVGWVVGAGELHLGHIGGRGLGVGAVGRGSSLGEAVFHLRETLIR